MGKKITIAAVMLLAVMSASGQTATSYEWWFDDDVSTARSGEVNSGQVTFTYDLSDIPQGLHYFNVRLSDSDGVWGAPYRRMVLTSPLQTEAVAYEYWIDDNYSEKKDGSFSEGTNAYTVSLEGVRKGLHRFNYRLKTYDGSWGSVYSQLFYYTSGNSPFTNYEYWIDNDYANKVIGTTNANSVSFNVDMSGMEKKGVHFFNLRATDDDGDWGSIYRKLVIFYDKENKASVIGYRHSLNGSELGYVTVENKPEGIYTFTIDLPDGAGFSMANAPIIFNGDELSVSHSEPIDYMIQIESEMGWAAPVSYSFDAEVNFSSNAEYMDIPSSLSFIKPSSTEFKAVKFASIGQPIYVRVNQPAVMDIYKDEIKVTTISPEELSNIKTLNLEAGTYYGVIHSVASDEESNEVLLTLDNSILDEVEIQYDGRYASLNSLDEDVEIYYTLDGEDPFDGRLYDGAFDVKGLCTVKAIAKKGENQYSSVKVLDIEMYSDEEHAALAKSGLLNSAFGWDETFSAEVETYRLVGPLDDSDFSYVREMKSLRYLDISNVSVENFPDRAFANTGLISVSMPGQTKDYGNNIFSGCENMSAIICNGTAAVTENLTSGISNPNLLVYVRIPDRTEILGSPCRNIVKGEYAERVYLNDGQPFYAPIDFTAFLVEYTRTFNKETDIDGCAGWETLTVPFDVQTISDVNGEVYPFAAESGDRRFWLYRPVGTGWERTDAIEAYMPYLIAMPNHPWYEESKNIRGSIEFRAENALIAATPAMSGVPYNNGLVMVANYLPESASNNVYVINDETTDEYHPGSVFASGIRDARPFEGYLTGTSAARYIPVFDTSEVETLLGDSGMRIWSENNDICIFSGIDARVRIHDMMGRLVRIADVRAREISRINDLSKGIYLVGDKKMYVK